MSRTGRALLFHGPGSAFETRTVRAPVPKSAGIRVRPLCCTICRSDLHTHAGRRPSKTPTVLGHEAIGLIDAFGPEAARRDALGRPLAEGDRITWSIVSSCGQCAECRRGLEQKCRHGKKFGHEPFEEGQAPFGGLADVTELGAGATVLKLGDPLEDAVACLANCATATVAAAFRGLDPLSGTTGLIQGAGVLGRTACAMAADLGATAFCADRDPARAEAARAFGASAALAADRERLAEAVFERTDGQGVDWALELSGSPEAIEAGAPLIRNGGRYVWIGAVMPSRPVPIEPEQVVRRLLTIQGLHNYGPRDLIEAVRFLEAPGRSEVFRTLIARTFDLEAADEAFAFAHRHPGLRVAVRP